MEHRQWPPRACLRSSTLWQRFCVFFMGLAPLIVPRVRGAEEERRCEELAAAAARSPLRISCRSAASWGVPWRSVRVPMTNASASKIEPEHIHVSRPHTFSPALSMTDATPSLDLPFDNASWPANIAACKAAPSECYICFSMSSRVRLNCSAISLSMSWLFPWGVAAAPSKAAEDASVAS